MRIAPLLLASALSAAAQTAPVFDVASVKPSAHAVGKDYRPRVEPTGGRFTAHNASLKDLILAAYNLDRYQLSGGPAWLDEDEFDVDARPASDASPDDVRLMLRSLLADRFALVVSSGRKEMRQYALLVDKGGPKIHPSKEGEPQGRFHGDMRQFANLLSIQLSIPTQATEDPSKPSIASGQPIPVIDGTGLTGIYDINAWPPPEPGLAGWQRVLQETLGLRLEPRRGSATVLTVEHAAKPKAN